MATGSRSSSCTAEHTTDGSVPMRGTISSRHSRKVLLLRSPTMIPKRMLAYLRERLPESTWDTRLVRRGNAAFLEFDATALDRRARLGIEVDPLGPRLVVCMWDEASPAEIGGYLVVDNLAMGRPSMGGIRLLPEITPATIHNLARGMTLKNAAAKLPYGGGKAGIVAEPGLSSQQHTEVVRGFARLLWHYPDLYLPGPARENYGADST